ncbi:MAG: hypothetical protein ACTSPB_24390 [Candidatus Thorarchaeota archaeon]
MASTKITELPNIGDTYYNTANDEILIYDGTEYNTQIWTETVTGDLVFTDENGDDWKLKDLAARLDAIEKRLAILPDPDSDKLEKHKMLRETYKKYKFLEELIGKEDEDDDNG